MPQKLPVFKTHILLFLLLCLCAGVLFAFTLEEYCDFIADCLELLPPSMVVHRITGDGPRALLLAPRWSTDKKRVLNTIRKRLQERKTYQGSKFQS